VRWLSLLCLTALVASAGCFGEKPLNLVKCDGQDHTVRLYLGPGHSLQPEVPSRGSVPGNSFAGAFATDNLDEWLSPSMLEPLHLTGTVRLSLWVEHRGSPAPIVNPQTGEGYQFFNQFGSDRTFQPGYATQYDVPVQAPGTQVRYSQSFTLPPGGFHLETGDRVRLLLTSLALDSDSGSGHDILYGNPTASSLTFQARCTTPMEWSLNDERVFDVRIPGNQGLFTGRIPSGPFNTFTAPLDLRPETQRLTIDLYQLNDANPVKDDIDIEILSSNGTAVWSIGTPYSNEHGILWSENLAYLREKNASAIRVNSYSGFLYQGKLTVTQEVGRPA
jgi:hypothetical protein